MITADLPTPTPLRDVRTPIGPDATYGARSPGAGDRAENAYDYGSEAPSAHAESEHYGTRQQLPIMPPGIYQPQTTDYMIAKAVRDCKREDPQGRETKTRSIHTTAVYNQRNEARKNPRQQSQAVELGTNLGRGRVER